MYRRILIVAVLALMAVASFVAQSDASVVGTGKTVMVCGGASDFAITAKPRTCFLDWPNLSLAEAMTLHRTHWRHWGHRTATAKAVYKVKTYDPWTKVRVKVSGRHHCAHAGYFVYTRVRVRFAHGYDRKGHLHSPYYHTWKTPGCSLGYYG